MIAGCIDKLRHDDCGTCSRKDACATLFSGLFQRGGGFARPRMPQREPRRDSSPQPFLAFLGRAAKVIEEGLKAQAQAQRTPPSGLRARVEAAIEPLLAHGAANIDRVARDLGLSRQTLYRRLKEEGTTFEAVLDGVRKRLGVRLIREGVAVKDAAYRLGFSDPAAFSRAFKRWTGSSPSAMRP